MVKRDPGTAGGHLRAALLTLVFATVLSILAMHHLGAGHDGMAGTMAMPAGSTMFSQLEAGPGMPDGPNGAFDAARSADVMSAVLGATASVPDGTLPAPVPVCLAVLVLVALVLVVNTTMLRDRRRGPPPISAGRPCARVHAPPTGTLLAQLCVLRT